MGGCWLRVQVSEKIVDLDRSYQDELNKSSNQEVRLEEMAADKETLLSMQDELRAEVQEKINLLDEFEDKFTRQYKSVSLHVTCSTRRCQCPRCRMQLKALVSMASRACACVK